MYTQNCFTNEQSPNGLFSISFTYDFAKGPQEIYFAHSVPYTYTMLNNYLNKNVTKELRLSGAEQLTRTKVAGWGSTGGLGAGRGNPL